MIEAILFALLLVYGSIGLAHGLSWLVRRTPLDRLMTRWTRGLLKGTGNHALDLLRCHGYTLRQAKRRLGVG